MRSSLVIALLFALAFSVPSLVGRDASPVKPLRESVRVTPKPQVAAKGRALEVSVDGAVTPELIPDDLAHRHFLAALSVRQPDEQDTGRRARMLRQVGLHADEEAAMASVLEGLGAELKAIDDSLKGYDGDDGAAARAGRETLKNQRRDLLDSGAEDVQARLKPESWQRYDDYVRGHVKSRIKIYTFPGHAEGKADPAHAGH